MAIRFRCEHCQTLMSIASRKAGMPVKCPACAEQVIVPLEDQMSPPPFAAAPPSAVPQPEATESPKFEPAAEHVALPDDFFAFDDDEEPPKAAEPPVEAEPEPVVYPEFTGYEIPVAPELVEIERLIDHSLDDALANPRVMRAESSEEKFTVPLRKSTIDDEMDLTPMVDVVFQLLIFFMVTASFALHKTIQTPTPDENQKGATQSIQSLEELEGVAILVRIDGQNGIFIDDEPLTDDSRIADALRDKMRKEQKSEIIITADAAAWHRTVVKVVDAGNEVGMQKIRLATRSGLSD
jgi:biopolymer transport protein ExbD